MGFDFDWASEKHVLQHRRLGSRTRCRAASGFFLSTIVPEALGLAAEAEGGAEQLFAVPAEALA